MLLNKTNAGGYEMKKNKSAERKRKAAAALAIILIIAMILSVAAPFFSNVYGMPATSAQTEFKLGNTMDNTIKPNEEIANDTLQMEPFVGIQAKGFNGYLIGKTTPFFVNIKNSATSSFQGEVQLKVYSNIDYDVDYNGKSYGEYSIYYVPVTLAPQEEKQIVLKAKCEIPNPFFEFSLVDNKNKIVVRKNVTANVIKPNTTMVGVLTENSNYDYLKKINFNLEGQETKYIAFDKDTFPIDTELLNNLNSLVINDFHTKKLSSGQTAALNDWIEKGGLLIVGTGPNASKTLEGLSSVVDVSIGESSFADGLTDNAAISYDFGAEAEMATLSFSQNTKKMEQFSRNGVTTTSSFAKGNGKIIIHNFDLNLVPMGNNAEIINTLQLLYYNHFVQENENKDLPYYLQHLADSFPFVELSGVYIIFGVVVLYLILIGPVLYFVLKKKDKREIGWIVIPIIAVVFTVVIFGFSQNSFYKNSMINFISAIEIKPNSQIGTAQILGALKTPEKGNVTFSMGKEANLDFFTDQNYYNRNRQKEKLLSKILEQSQDKIEITYFGNESWKSNYVYTSSFKTDLEGTIDTNITMKEKSFIGTITNNTKKDFYDAVILIAGQAQKYDSLKAGQTLDIKLEISDEIAYSAGNSLDTQKLFGQDYDSRQVTKEKIKSGELTEEEAHAIRLRMQILQYVNRYTQYDTNVGAKIPASFYAFDTVPLLNGEKFINGKKVVENTQNVYKMDFDIDLAKVESFDIPYGIIPVSSVYGLGAKYEKENNFIYFDGDKCEITCSFQISQNIPLQLFQIDALWAESSYYQPPEIYNVKTQSWEKLSQDEYKNASDYIENDGEYVYAGAKNGMQMVSIKIFVGGENGGISAPRIRIKGGNENVGN